MKRVTQNYNPEPPQPAKPRYWFWGILGIASLMIVLQATGIFKSVNKTQSSGWIDTKSAEYQNRKMPERRPEKPQPMVDATLQEIAAEFEGPIFTDIRTANQEKGWGLTDDEAHFYDNMRQQYGPANQNWLGLAKKSYATYRTVKEALGGSADALSVLKDAQTAMSFYSKISELYGVSPTESANFAQSANARTAGDWATFVESRRQVQ